MCSDSWDLSDFLSPYHLNYLIIYIILLIVFYSSDNSLMINSMFRRLFTNGCFNDIFTPWFIYLLGVFFLYLEFLSKINEYLLFSHFLELSLSSLFWKNKPKQQTKTTIPFHFHLCNNTHSTLKQGLIYTMT